MRAESGGDPDICPAGAGVEPRFTNAPVGSGGSSAHPDTGGGDADVLGVSLRWDNGEASLKGRARGPYVWRVVQPLEPSVAV